MRYSIGLGIGIHTISIKYTELHSLYIHFVSEGRFYLSFQTSQQWMAIRQHVTWGNFLMGM